MKRRLVPVLAVLTVLVLAGLLILVLLRDRRPPVPPSATLPEPEAVDPLRTEMDCIDRVTRNRNLRPEEVQPALAACRGGSGSGRADVNSSQ